MLYLQNIASGTEEKHKNKNFLLICIFLIIGFSSCKITKHVPEEQYLLQGYKIDLDSREVDKKELKSYIKQKPNRKVLGLKFPLFIYNLSNPEKEKGLSKWLANTGEEPVIWDRHMMNETKKQIVYFLENEGYYNSVVEDTVHLSGRKAKVFFDISLNEPFVIRNLKYEVIDSSVQNYVYADTARKVLEEGDVFSVEQLQKERTRIENLLKDKGFYRFSKDFITYVADTTSGENSVDLTIRVEKYPQKTTQEEEGFKEVSHKRYKLNKIFVFPDYDPKQAIAQKQDYLKNLDTTRYKNIDFIYRGNPGIDLKTITQSNYLNPGDFYSQRDVNRTYEHLNSLRIFKLINIRFVEDKDSLRQSENQGELNCFIYLKKFKVQSYTIELEGTNSSGNIGGAGNVLYRHKSLLNGAENFETKLTGAFEILDPERFNRIDNTTKLGVVPLR